MEGVGGEERVVCRREPVALVIIFLNLDRYQQWVSAVPHSAQTREAVLLIFSICWQERLCAAGRPVLPDPMATLVIANSKRACKHNNLASDVHLMCGSHHT